MNYSIYSADRQTHLKIVVVGLLCACFVLIVGVFAHGGHLDLGTAPLVKAGGALHDQRTTAGHSLSIRRVVSCVGSSS